MSTRPSFFEVYAAQHLSAALRPAVRFVFDVFSVRNPRLIPLATHSDEIFTALLLVLETSQLRRDSALLAESFYSLRRTVFASFHAQAAEQPLATRHVVLSLVFSVLIPHIAVKCQQWYSDQTGGAAAAFFPDGIPQVPAESLAVHPSLQLSTANVTPNPQTQSRLNRLLIRLFQSPKRLMNLFNALRHYTTTPAFRSLAMKWYPRVCAFFETINMLFNVAYMYGHTRYFSLSLALQGLVLRRSGPIDLLHLTTSKMYSATQYSSPLYRFLSAASERLLMLLKSGFIASIFAFRFLQYYYAAEVCYAKHIYFFITYQGKD